MQLILTAIFKLTPYPIDISYNSCPEVGRKPPAKPSNLGEL
jgi:hypothetical protein